MHLYTGSSQQFINDVVQNRIAASMRSACFNHFRFHPSPGELHSWQNSLRAVCNVLQYGSFNDNGVVVEYQLPLTSKRSTLPRSSLDRTFTSCWTNSMWSSIRCLPKPAVPVKVSE